MELNTALLEDLMKHKRESLNLVVFQAEFTMIVQSFDDLVKQRFLLLVLTHAASDCDLLSDWTHFSEQLTTGRK